MLIKLITFSIVALTIPYCIESSIEDFLYNIFPDNSKGKIIYNVFWNESTILRNVDSPTMKNLSYNPSKNYALLFHGYFSKGTLYTNVTEGLVKNGVVVIPVTYEHAVDSINYLAAVNNLDWISDDIASVVCTMNKSGVSLDNVSLIGHSLGGHLTGRVGRKVSKLCGNHKIGKIFSLDPPFLMINGLSKNDAKFVMVIHTSSLSLFFDQIGHIDFYPNGGLGQYPCSKNRHISSHGISWYYFAEGIFNPTKFKGYKCSIFCSKSSKSYNTSDIAYMTYFVDTNKSGAYYVPMDEHNCKAPNLPVDKSKKFSIV